MHTFFINTSKKELNEYDVLFDIHFENKTLVSMDCPMSDWYDSNKGYAACVKQMGDMIDGYVELNNAFNLIIYIDLSENEAYSSIQKDAFHDKAREECCRAMHILFTHVVSESIINELTSSGRKPQNVLIMFGEEKQFTDFYVAPNDTSKLSIMKYVFDFMGLPEDIVVEKIAKTIIDTDALDKPQAFSEEISKSYVEEIVPGIRERYSTDLHLWCDTIINEANIKKANEDLFDRINGTNRSETDRIGIETISCPYDFYACKVNKSILALSQLNIALYLLKCVENESIYESSSSEDAGKLIEFYSYSVQEIVPALKNKEAVYSAKATEIESLAKSYTELNLAPQLFAFDYMKFGLDVFGDKAVDLIVRDVQSQESIEEKEASDSSKETGETIAIKGNIKEVTLVEKEGRKLFSNDEYKEFDYNFDQDSHKMLKKKTTPEEYIEQAKKIRKHHLDYLKKLKVHVSSVLSNYAGKSKENKPAILQIGGYRYARPEEESQVIESVESVSSKAYDSMINQYMEFCAGRSVAISDIEDQCNWFVSRVHQIRESLKRIKRVAVGILFAILLIYAPFVIIQFEAIFENALTFGTALGSIAVPLVLLYFIFSVVALAQRKKYIQAWLKFKEKSDQALEENKIAVKKYDQLLSVIVPALRWVYEYKLDVDYCVECCSVADAKVEHHRKKLRERVFNLQNILSDLEINFSEREESQTIPDLNVNSIDYNVSFCSGKKNKSFYSVIDKKFFEKKKND